MNKFHMFPRKGLISGQAANVNSVKNTDAVCSILLGKSKVAERKKFEA